MKRHFPTGGSLFPIRVIHRRIDRFPPSIVTGPPESKMKFLKFLLILTVFTQPALVFADATQWKVDTLRCEYLVNPLGMDQTRPRLSWVVRTSERGAAQTGYQILVASDPEILAKDEGDLWDTGKVESAENAHIVYSGPEPKSKQRLHWKVRVWDGKGVPSPWSEPAAWEMGLLESDDWKAEWVEAPAEISSNVASGRNLFGAAWIWSAEEGADLKVSTPDGTRHFQKRFEIPASSRIKEAQLLITVDDAFEASVNGRKVGAFDEKDGWRKLQTFDVKPVLKSGENVLTVSATNRGGQAGLCAKLLLTFEDGKTEAVVTDGSWQAATAAAEPKSSEWAEAVEVCPFGEGPWGSMGSFLPRPVPILRKRFELADKPIARARLYATALGVYEVLLNGSRVGDRVLAPEWTDYNKRVFYQTYDVTDALTGGANALAAMIGDGWYCGHVAWSYNFYGTKPAFLAQLEVTYDDGTTDIIATDATWKAHAGPILGSDLLMGEIYDARLEVPGMASAGLDDTSWQAVRVREERTDRSLDWQPSEPVRVLMELPAKEITQPEPGKWIVDLGQNMVGWIRLAVKAPAGTQITLRHGEMLKPDGTLYTENLRTALATDVYVCKGGGLEVWEPRFTFHGFRYVELSGLPGTLSKDAVKGIVVGSDTPKAGTFTSSSPLLNQLQSNIEWGQRGNFLSIPTDCPQRNERLGWMGDAQVFIRTATMNADVAAFFTKWFTDVTDAQFEDGRYADVAPRIIDIAGAPGWGDAGVICPWTIYQIYGDTQVLERHYDGMVKWIEWCREQSTDLIRDRDRGADHGDWLSINADTPKDLVGTAYFAYSTDLVSRIAGVLGREDDAAKYRGLFEDIKAAFIKRFVKPDGRIGANTQAGYAMALKLNLVPDELRTAAARYLVEDIKAKGDHISTGFLGVSYLLPVLTETGHVDTAFKLLLQESFPSWLFSVKQGATTIWERWDGWTPDKGFQDVGMNSFNHYSFGSCGEWMFGSLAGIGLDPSAPAYRHIVFQPQVGGGLTEAKARLETIRGTAACGWKKTGGSLSVNCVVPVGSTATVVLPTSNPAGIREGGKPLGEVPSVKPLRVENGNAYLSIGSGTYQFTCPL
jgi:Alpha-L-rhamnosidase N-terminal domain./Bacterial alpha-L-rhamnosidase.